MTGALAGIRVVEFAGLGPGPFCAMMLADHGADVVRISRPGHSAMIGKDADDFLTRSRRNIALDLKAPEALGVARRLCIKADIVIEGFRPGVMERMGLGPKEVMQDNPRLVYGRMTGWGQDGPYASMAGHDINFIALSGALHAIGRAGDRPVPPLNLVGDFGGGGLMLAFGVLAALQSAKSTGKGQVVDCSMVEGSAVLMSMIYSLRSQGAWHDAREANMIDGGAPYYDTYETLDGRYVAIGAVEPQFFKELLELTGLAGDPLFANQNRIADWPAQKARLRQVFLTKSRDQWCALFEGSDACFAPILSLDEASRHKQNAHRRVFTGTDGMQPGPAPRTCGTPVRLPEPLIWNDAATASILDDLGYSEHEIAGMRKNGVAV